MKHKMNNSLFAKLKRVFSNDVIIRNVGGNKINTVDINSLQHSNKLQNNSLIRRYNNININNTSLYGQHFQQQYQYLRPQLYSEYDVMDTHPIIASALDIIADESTLKNEMGEVLQIRSSNEDIQDHLYNLFYDVINIEFNLWAWVRQLCKYGDFFLKLEIAQKYGVYNVIPYTAFNIDRQEGFNEEKPHAVRYQYFPHGTIGNSGRGTYSNSENDGGIYFDHYEMGHFRLLADTSYLPFGRSYLEPARKLYKQYSLMEDAMLIHRISRAPEKRIYYIDVQGLAPNEIDAFMEKTITNLKRTPHQNPETGEYDLNYNLSNMLEDIYIPNRGDGSNTKVDTAKGLEYDGIKDVEYLRDHLFAALKVPKAFLGFEADLEGKATLASEDIRFGRTIDRIQRIVISELNKIAIVHLYSLGYRDEDMVNFELSLTTPSIIYDQEKIELLKSKTELAGELLEKNLVPIDWIYENIFHFSEEQYNQYKDQIIFDAHNKFRLSQIQTEGNDPNESGKSYGTPHDLATLYGKARDTSDPSNIPDGYNENVDLGRPKNSITNRGKQENNFGKDPLGKKRMEDKKPKTPNKKRAFESIKPTLNPYLEYSLKKITIPKEKQLIKEEEDYNNTILDDSNLKD